MFKFLTDTFDAACEFYYQRQDIASKKFPTDKLNVGSVRVRARSGSDVICDGVIVEDFANLAELRKKIHAGFVNQNAERDEKEKKFAFVFDRSEFDTNCFTPDDIKFESIEHNFMHASWCHSNAVYKKSQDQPRHVWGVEARIPYKCAKSAKNDLKVSAESK
jgi:hypothetical protein